MKARRTLAGRLAAGWTNKKREDEPQVDVAQALKVARMTNKLRNANAPNYFRHRGYLYRDKYDLVNAKNKDGSYVLSDQQAKSCLEPGHVDLGTVRNPVGVGSLTERTRDGKLRQRKQKEYNTQRTAEGKFTKNKNVPEELTPMGVSNLIDASLEGLTNRLGAFERLHQKRATEIADLSEAARMRAQATKETEEIRKYKKANELKFEATQKALKDEKKASKAKDDEIARLMAQLAQANKRTAQANSQMPEGSGTGQHNTRQH